MKHCIYAVIVFWHLGSSFHTLSSNKQKYQGVKDFHMLARIGCYCNIMVFSPFKVKVTYYHPPNLWLLGATNGNHGQTVMHLQCSETINHS